MPDLVSLAGFMAAALIVLIIPGPGVVYIVVRSVSQGQRAGFVSAAGLSVGALVHVLAATVGLSAILLTSATAFSVVKLLGAAYLIYLGIQAFRSRGAELHLGTTPPRPLRQLFTDGVIVSVLNPKIAVFFLAFLPQFVNPAQGPVAYQVMFLGCVYAGLAFLTDSTYALLASKVRGWLGDAVAKSPWPRYGSGVILVGLGVGTALAERD